MKKGGKIKKKCLNSKKEYMYINNPIYKICKMTPAVAMQLK